ncbi:MAG: hybrid sensor histidine kinase/response regulator [Verrucomicrobiota bacterium]
MNNAEAEFLKKLRATFKIEAEEHLHAMSSLLIELEKSLPHAQSKERIEVIFRHAHSLKGAARAVGFVEIESLCQSLESFFLFWKRDEIVPETNQFDTLHRALDLIKKSIAAPDAPLPPEESARLGTMHVQLTSLTGSRRTPELSASETSSQKRPETLGKSTSLKAHDAASASVVKERSVQAEHESSVTSFTTVSKVQMESIASRAEPFGMPEQSRSISTVRISTHKLDQLLAGAEEILAIKLGLLQRTAELRDFRSIYERWKGEWTRMQPRWRKWHRASSSEMSALASQPTTNQSESVGDFLDWSETQLKALETKLELVSRSAAQDQAAMARRVDEFLLSTKQLLMLPFSTLLEFIPKLVRDLSREQGKEVNLVLRGGDVEMDKRILEQIKDPLIHLLRNCVDHGIENPQVRESKKKPACATVVVAMARLDGSRVEILVSDDGAGINLADVKQAAVQRGIVTAEQASKLNEAQTLPLIFQPEVSTSRTVTEISGRGLGLAIVREKIEKLGGRILVETHPHVGTTFRMVLPISVATFRGLHIKVSGQAFIVPTWQVERAIRIKQGDIKYVENCETIVVDQQAVSVARLATVLELPHTLPQKETHESLCALLLKTTDDRIAFIVDELIEEQEVVVKPLPKPLLRVRHFSGATLLPSGKVVPILNVSDLLKSARNARSIPPPGEATATVLRSAESKRRRILVVEDSITSRMLLKNILESAGHEVKTAVDGLEALTELRTSDFDLVVSDIEMPRLNGFDLTTRIRADRKLAQKPVILVTALASREDRERGIEVGANAYIVKSSFDQSNLLEAIGRLT